jgi:hypothetical protein
MDFAVTSDHLVNAREASRSSRGKRAGNLFNTPKAIENGVPGIALRGDKMIEGDYRLPFLACAVQRRRFPVGASPTRQPLQPEAIGAVMEVTKWLKPSISVSRIGV